MFELRFQTFDDSSERSESAGRVERLRAELARRGLDGFVVPRADRQQNEYLPASEERLAWLTGFTGSAGAAIVLANRAVLFVDGRYTVQAAMQVDGGIFALDNLVDRPPDQWLDQNLKSGDRIGYDPWLHTVEGVERLKKACANAGASLLPVDDNPIDALWTNRPAPPSAAVVLRDVKFAGESAADKLKRVRTELAKLRADALVVSDPQNVAWTFNIRGSDVAHTPLALAFALVPKEGRPAALCRRQPARRCGTPRAGRHRRSASAGRAIRRSRRAQGQDGAARPGKRGRSVHAADRRGRRQAATRRRSDYADEGGEEPRRNRGHARSPCTRRRRSGALPRLARPRGAGGKAH